MNPIRMIIFVLIGVLFGTLFQYFTTNGIISSLIYGIILAAAAILLKIAQDKEDKEFRERHCI